MKKTRFVMIVLLAAALSLLLSGCFYVPSAGAGTARAAFTVRSVALNMTSIALIVSGPGMDTITNTYPASQASITLTVPAGPARTFTLLLNNVSVTLQDQVTVDLLAGQAKEISLTPVVAGTQLIIPDAKNNRVVQISDMAGTGWIAKGGSDFGTGAGTFTPWDVDFDSQGRIYIANNAVSGGTLGGVIRIDDINSTAGFTNVAGATMAVAAIAVDRANGYIYYTPGYSTLYRKSLADLSAAAVTYNLNAETAYMANFSTNGIAVDAQGYLYIVNSIGPQLLKYDPKLPEGSRVVKSSSYSFASGAWGVMIKEPYLYVADASAGPPNEIVRFDKDLGSPASYPGPVGDIVLGAKRFIGVLNKKITFTDEDTSVLDRLVSMDDITGSGWTTYGTNGYGAVGTFRFFAGC